MSFLVSLNSLTKHCPYQFQLRKLIEERDRVIIICYIENLFYKEQLMKETQGHVSQFFSYASLGSFSFQQCIIATFLPIFCLLPQLKKYLSTKLRSYVSFYVLLACKMIKTVVYPFSKLLQSSFYLYRNSIVD